jgi:dolichol kinase
MVLNKFVCNVPRYLSYLKLRKLVHISGVLFPGIAIYSGKEIAVAIVIFLTLLFLGTELIKPKIREYSFFRLLWRKNEYERFALEPLLYLLSIMALLLLSYRLDEGICYASIVVLTVGDGLATIVGIHGKMCYGGSSKTVEGTAAGILGATICSLPFAGPISLAGAVGGMYVESRTGRHDNLTVPFAALLGMVVMQFLVNIYISITA